MVDNAFIAYVDGVKIGSRPNYSVTPSYSIPLNTKVFAVYGENGVSILCK